MEPLCETAPETALFDSSACWNWQGTASSRQAIEQIDAIMDAMIQEGYSERDRFAVQLALHEAVSNAVRHGNRNDQRRSVTLRYMVDADRVLVDVEDEGAGFNPDSLPDPLAPENLLRTGGRGLLLMRAFMTAVQVHPPGNRITLCKERSTDADAAHVPDPPPLWQPGPLPAGPPWSYKESTGGNHDYQGPGPAHRNLVSGR